MYTQKYIFILFDTNPSFVDKSETPRVFKVNDIIYVYYISAVRQLPQSLSKVSLARKLARCEALFDLL